MLCGGNPGFRDDRLFNRFLYVRFMQIIPPVFSRRRNMGQLSGREKPLPDKLLGRILIFFLQGVH